MVFEVDFPVKPNAILPDYLWADTLFAGGNSSAIGNGNLFVNCGTAIMFIVKVHHLWLWGIKLYSIVFCLFRAS